CWTVESEFPVRIYGVRTGDGTADGESRRLVHAIPAPIPATLFFLSPGGDWDAGRIETGGRVGA
uniref:hypothetical protein n=1 Tax=Salmonella enterica TaxID=28901 RepID=UPI0020C3973C